MDSTEMQETLSYEMSVGIVFEEETLTTSFQETTIQSVETTYTSSGLVTITQRCPPSPLDDDPSIGFWIWKVRTDENDAVSINPVGVCRYGIGEFNVAPSCPLAACIDYRCNECKDWTDDA